MKIRPLAVALLGSALLVTGCSSPSSEPRPAAVSAEQQLAATTSATKKLSSFEFRSVSEIVTADGASTSRTLIEGRAILPDSVSYEVTAGDGGAQVVALGPSSFTRTLPDGQWKTAPASEPVAPGKVLADVLAAADNPELVGPVTFDGRRARQFTVQLTADEVRRTGLLDAAGGGLVLVQVAVDDSDRVVRLGLEFPVSAADGTTATLRQVTTYGTFGKAAPIAAPVVP